MKALERRYSKSERIIAKARFSAWAYLKVFILAAILGGIIACIWIYGNQIENYLLKKDGETIYLTDYVMKFVVAGAAALVLLCFIIQAISLYNRELILTENKVVYRVGIIDVKSATITLSSVKSVEYRANIIQRLLRYGNIVIIMDAQRPYTIRGISSADRLSRRIMKQVTQNTNDIHNQLVKIQLSGSTNKKKGH